MLLWIACHLRIQVRSDIRPEGHAERGLGPGRVGFRPGEQDSERGAFKGGEGQAGSDVTCLVVRGASRVHLLLQGPPATSLRGCLLGTRNVLQATGNLLLLQNVRGHSWCHGIFKTMISDRAVSKAVYFK